MKLPEPGTELDADQLALWISVAMASDTKHAPILRGRHAPDRMERDRLRQEFARWLAERILASNLKVTLAKPSATSRIEVMRD